MTRRNFITHLSPNSSAAVAAEIEKQGVVHWLNGLRQAELFIFDRARALDEQYQAQHDFEREVAAYGRQKRALIEIENHPIKRAIALFLIQLNAPFRPVLTLRERIEATQDKLDAAQRNYQYMSPMIRDALSELRMAEQERSLIISAHPEVETMTFEQIQEHLTPICLLNSQAKYIASLMWARESGLPMEAAQSVFSMPPEKALATLTEASRQVSTYGLKALISRG